MSRYTITEILASAKGDAIPVMQTAPPYTLSFNMYYQYNSRGDAAIYDGKQFWQLRHGVQGTRQLGRGTQLPGVYFRSAFAVNDTQYVTYCRETREDCLYMHRIAGKNRPVPIQSTRYTCSSTSVLALSDTRVYMSHEYIGHDITMFAMHDLVHDKKIVKTEFKCEAIMTVTDNDIAYFVSRKGHANTAQLYDTRANVGLVDMGRLFDGPVDNIRTNAGLCGEYHLVQITMRNNQHVVIYDTRACASYNYEDFYQSVFVVYV